MNEFRYQASTDTYTRIRGKSNWVDEKEFLLQDSDNRVWTEDNGVWYEWVIVKETVAYSQRSVKKEPPNKLQMLLLIGAI